MSAGIVLILRILLVISIYGFLWLSLSVIWREIKNIHQKTRESVYPHIVIAMDKGKSLAFNQPEIKIGRSQENDMVIPEDTVSLFHARLFYNDGKWMLEDNHSTNGTILNDELVQSPTVLVDQDKISIGSQTLQVQMNRADSAG